MASLPPTRNLMDKTSATRADKPKARPRPRPALDRLADLPALLHKTDGFEEVLASLRLGRSATVDGAWGSSAGLVAAALAREAPRTLLVTIAHPRDVDAWLG